MYKIINLTALFLLVLFSKFALAHNNPDFKQVELGVLTTKVDSSLKIIIPDETTKLIWKTKPDTNNESIISIVDSNGKTLEKVSSGSFSSDLALYKGKTISISTNNNIKDDSFELVVFANVIDRSKKHSQSTASAGKKVFKKANCMGCHKWHGGGGGGYGGAAASLRITQLNKDQMKYFIECGMVGTRMPYHSRSAYKNDDKSCYGQTRKELGEHAPPRGRILLSAREINLVTDYVLNTLKGKGAPTKEECFNFWGPESRMCKAMKE